MPTSARPLPLNVRTRLCVLALLLAGATAALGQSPAATDPAKPPSDFNDRLNSALNAENKHDYETAYRLYKQLIIDAPANRAVFMQAAIAARGAGHPEEALTLYQRATTIGEPGNKYESMVVIPIYAALGRWDDFDREHLAFRAAAIADPTLLSGKGFVIDEFKAGAREFRVLEYPALHGHFNTRYRFLVVSEGTPDFTPYYDLESDDGDQAFFQKDHPELAKKGERLFSLDSYPKPGSQALMGFFNGEPPYKIIRASVIGKQDAKPDATMNQTPPKK